MASNHVRAAVALPRALGRVGVRGGRAPLARMDGAAELVCGHPHCSTLQQRERSVSAGSCLTQTGPCASPWQGYKFLSQISLSKRSPASSKV